GAVAGAGGGARRPGGLDVELAAAAAVADNVTDDVALDGVSHAGGGWGSSRRGHHRRGERGHEDGRRGRARAGNRARERRRVGRRDAEARRAGSVGAADRGRAIRGGGVAAAVGTSTAISFGARASRRSLGSFGSRRRRRQPPAAGGAREAAAAAGGGGGGGGGEASGLRAVQRPEDLPRTVTRLRAGLRQPAVARR